MPPSANATPVRSPRSGFAHLDQARSIQVETPEHVRLGFELAGMGSRSAAVIVDVMVLSALGTVLMVPFAVTGVLASSPWIFNLGLAVIILAVFVLQWGYFFACEAFFDGRTLGKRWLGIRVIGQGGTPITIQAAALRNLLRIIDLQPAGSSLIGLGLIGFHPRGQRLGDIVAGTVVVRDRGSHEIPEVASAKELGERPHLDPQRFEMLERYVGRRESLPPAVRTRLAGRVAKAIGPLASEHPSRRTATLDQILQDIYESDKPRQTVRHGVSVQAVQLVREQTPRWTRLRELVEKSGRRGLPSLHEDEIEEFTELYRETVADLARAHTYGGSLRLSFHLERLAGEAHNLFYRGRHEGPSTLRWLRAGFPRAFRAHRTYVAVAAALVFLPSIVTYLETRDDPELGRRLVPVEMVTRAEQAGERLRTGEQYIDIPPVQMSVFSSSIMTNNLQVAVMAAAGGILAGVGTVVVLIFNGVHLGSVFSLYALNGAAPLLWMWVLPHGVLEMTAIVVAGTAGLVLGRAILAPGRRTRAEAVQAEGIAVLSLVAGAGILLVLAGLIEGFVSPAEISAPLKMSFAAVVAALLALYLGLAGRGPREPDASP